MWRVLLFPLLWLLSRAEAHSKVLVTIPGMGLHVNRTKVVVSNIHDLYHRQASKMVEIDCLIYAYKTLPKALEKRLAPCSVVYLYHGNYAMYMKALVPQLIKEAGYTHVFVLLDDVRLTQSFNLSQILTIMSLNNLTIASPGVSKASMRSTLPLLPFVKSRRTEGRFVLVIEIFSTIFTPSAWSCWWNMMQPSLNPSGWGYDLCLLAFCRDPVASSKENLKLRPPDSITAFTSSYGTVMSQMTQHEKDLGRLAVTTKGLADQWLVAKVRPPP
jgi:hypothetical protein